MTALRSGAALARALILLVALAGAALAQAPSASDWRSVGAAWVEICTAPCRVTNGSTYPVRIAVGSSVPTSDDAAAAVLTSGDATREYVVAGLKIYGRALTSATRVVIEPLGLNMPAKQTTDGALEPATCAAGSGKCPAWFAQVPANASTQLLGANPLRIGVSIQCTGSAQVAVSETGATLTTATPAANSGISLVIPTGGFPYFVPPITSRSAITAYTGTSQSCWGTEYLR